MVEQLSKSELELLIESIQRGPSQVIGFDRSGQNQKDFEMGWNAAKDQIWSVLCAIKSKQEESVNSEVDDLTPEQEFEYKQYLASQPVWQACVCCGKNQVEVSAGEDSCSSCV